MGQAGGHLAHVGHFLDPFHMLFHDAKFPLRFLFCSVNRPLRKATAKLPKK
jgi:hypothetical protein